MSEYMDGIVVPESEVANDLGFKVGRGFPCLDAGGRTDWPVQQQKLLATSILARSGQAV